MQIAGWLTGEHDNYGERQGSATGFNEAANRGRQTQLKVLGIESSCDETGIAVYEHSSADNTSGHNPSGHKKGRGLLAHVLHSQVDKHAAYGGVVPEIASRDHVRKWLPLTRQCLRDAGLQLGDIDAIAYTSGPGLAGALFTGAVAGQSLAWALQIPAIGVNHMEGHLLAPMLEPDPPEYPFICLLVSGGHTQLVRVDGMGQYRLLGDTLDDAVGEAFDKTAKMLGLGYPGGPRLAEAAQSGDVDRFRFARPMTSRPGLDFSFSGLKTAAITAFTEVGQHAESVADIAVAFETAAVDALSIKCARALQQENINCLVASGGVAANKRLRATLAEMVKRIEGRVYFPRMEFCTDNGAMIALAGAIRLAAGEYNSLSVNVRPRWSIDQLSSPSAGMAAVD